MKKISKAYLSAAREASRGLIRNWILLIASMLAYIIFEVSAALFGGLGMTGGLLMGIVQIVLLTYFYTWISETIQSNKLVWNELIQFDYSIFSNLISVAFIFFVVQFLVQGMIQGLAAQDVMLFLNLGLVFLFNPIPEVIIVNRNQSIPALMEAMEFTRDKLIPWFIPLLLVLAPWVIIAPKILVYVFAKSDPLLPGATIFELMSSLIPLPYVNALFGVIIAVWFTLFRMHLFKELS